MKKRLFHTVNLRLFQDDATGDYGLAHENTYNAPNNAFNAFWGGIGIFHDVFEHWFEVTHKYFKGDNSLNRGGECAAMGAAWYYYNSLDLTNRPLGSYNFFGDSIRVENENAIIEAVKCGYTQYGSTLECGVPDQAPTEDGELEYQIKKLWSNVKNVSPDREEEYSETYKESVTFRKIANLYRWGYRMAEKLVPDNRVNGRMLYDFINFWNEFCKNNSAEELYNVFRSLEIKLYKDSEGFVTWKAKLISSDRFVKDIQVTTTYVRTARILYGRRLLKL